MPTPTDEQMRDAARTLHSGADIDGDAVNITFIEGHKYSHPGGFTFIYQGTDKLCGMTTFMFKEVESGITLYLHGPVLCKFSAVKEADAPAEHAKTEPKITHAHTFKGDPLNDDHYDSDTDQIADLKAEVARLLERNTDLILAARPVLERELELREVSGLDDYIKEVADALAAINKE